MRKFREYNQINTLSEELFLPDYLLKQSVFESTGIIIGGISTLRKGTIISREKNRAYHIIILTLKGKGKFKMEDGSEILLNEGEFFFSSAKGQGHKHYPLTDEWKICWLQLDQKTGLLISPPEDWTTLRCTRTKEIGNAFESIITEYLEQGINHIRIEELQLNLVLQYIKRDIDQSSYTGKNIQYIKRFSQLWKEVSTKIQLPWDIDMLCDFMGLSKTHLVRLCNELYNTSPARKVKEYKMEYAYKLLLNFNYRVTDVAEAIGFNSISSFTYAFKNHFGVLPKDIQKTNDPNTLELKYNNSI